MVLFPDPRDIALLQDFNKEVHTSFFPEIKLFIRHIDKEPHDPMYGESDGPYWEADPIIIPAYVDYSIERRRELGEFGKDEERDYLIWVSTKILNEHKLQIKPGDVFIVGENEHVVIEERLESQFANENIYFDRAYITKMRKLSTVRDERADLSINEPRPEEAVVKPHPGGAPIDAEGETDYPFDYNYPEGPYDP